MIDVINDSAVASPYIASKVAKLKERDWSPAATVGVIAKDMDLALELEENAVLSCRSRPLRARFLLLSKAGARTTGYVLRSHVFRLKRKERHRQSCCLSDVHTPYAPAARTLFGSCSENGIRQRPTVPCSSAISATLQWQPGPPSASFISTAGTITKTASAALRRSQHRNAPSILPRPVILCWPRRVFCSIARRSPNSIRCGAMAAIGCPASRLSTAARTQVRWRFRRACWIFFPADLPPIGMDSASLMSRQWNCVRRGLVGVFFVTTGPLHRAIHYHWHHSWPDWEKHRRALAENPMWRAFADSYRPRVVGSSVSYLRLSSVLWMRSLFESIDWSAN